MKSLKYIYYLLAILLVVGVLDTMNKKYGIVERLLALRFDSGEVKLVALSESIELSKITILQGNRLIVNKGKIVGLYSTKYGWSCFNVSYDSKKLTDILYFKKNQQNVNDHIFTFDKDTATQISVSLSLQGIDSLTEIIYKPIAASSLQLGRGVPKKRSLRAGLP